jgi:hypothetical protein
MSVEDVRVGQQEGHDEKFQDTPASRLRPNSVVRTMRYVGCDLRGEMTRPGRTDCRVCYRAVHELGARERTSIGLGRFDLQVMG